MTRIEALCEVALEASAELDSLRFLPSMVPTLGSRLRRAVQAVQAEQREKALASAEEPAAPFMVREVKDMTREAFSYTNSGCWPAHQNHAFDPDLEIRKESLRLACATLCPADVVVTHAEAFYAFLKGEKK